MFAARWSLIILVIKGLLSVELTLSNDGFPVEPVFLSHCFSNDLKGSPDSRNYKSKNISKKIHRLKEAHSKFHFWLFFQLSWFFQSCERLSF